MADPCLTLPRPVSDPPTISIFQSANPCENPSEIVWESGLFRVVGLLVLWFVEPAAGELAGVDPRLIHAVIRQESKYDSNATSAVGAKGLMQLMPDTGKRFHCADLGDKQCNVEAGTKYLAWLLKKFNGDVTLTLAAYNAGEGSVDKYKGIPPYHETENYVKKIVADYGKTYHPIVSPDEAKVTFHLTDNESDQSASGE